MQRCIKKVASYNAERQTLYVEKLIISMLLALSVGGPGNVVEARRKPSP